MNLLFINYEYPPVGGGAANATREIARAMTNLGHKAVVLTSQTPNKHGYATEGKIEVYRIRSIRRRIDRSSILEMFSFVLVAMRKAPGISKEMSIDGVICFFSLPCGLVGLFLNKCLRFRYVVSLRGGDVPGLVPELNLFHWLLAPIRRAILFNAEAVFANSVDLAEKSMRADSRKVEVIPNGVDRFAFRPARLKAKYNSGLPIHLLFVGRFHSQKDVPGMLEMLGKAHANHGLDFKLTLVGDGPEYKKARQVATKIGLNKMIDWKGWLGRSELIGSYQQADCFLNLSRYEGLPNTVLEAMSCGLVVVASDIAPHRELIEPEVTGYLVPIDQPKVLTRTLNRIAENSAKREKIAKYARERVVTNYSWESAALSYVKPFGVSNV